MRSTLEIIVAVKDSKPVTEDELKLALMAMSSFFYLQTKAAKEAQSAYNTDSKALKLRMSELGRVAKMSEEARKMDPEQWLGPANIPGTEQYAKQNSFHKGIFKKATGLDLDDLSP